MKRFAVATAIAAVLLVLPSALASHTPAPTAVTIAGSLQSELGCPGDWQPDCAATHLTYDAIDEVWQGSFVVSAGSWEYKAPLNDSWTENYGANATRDGANIGLTLGSPATVKFYYDHDSHWVTSNRNATIATAPGSFQSELGCPGDWDPGCLRSWLQDPDGNGTYVLQTTAIPAGSYEAKVAIDESWAENYGQGGVRDGANIPFSVPAGGGTVTFSYVASSHVLSISVQGSGGPVTDNNVEWDGVRHDSRDLLYRTPGGAVPAGTAVRLRLRTFHDDVTGVKARLFDVNANAQRIVALERVAEDVSCYQTSVGSRTCDFWELVLPNGAANNLWYRFVVTDGSDTDYYADDTAALDGGTGAVTDDAVDRSYALTVYEPGFTAPAWARSAFVYQIFPDRFRDGNAGNNPVPGKGNLGRLANDPRYAYPGGDPGGSGAVPAWDQIVQMHWNELPEGYCRNYSAGACPQRFAQPPADREGPRGRDYFGGDLQGIVEKLDYLRDLGVTAIYLNPIFDGGSNHGYDTQDYTRIDPYFGNLDHWERLRREAERRDIRLVLDGVFNHLSSDSSFFDRYQHYAQVGACESAASAFRPWFVFVTGDAPCGPGDYEGWFGFDSIPVLQKSRADVQDYFVRGQNSIAALWLSRGAGGWRLDVSGDPSFPPGYWEAFRTTAKQTQPDALTISETWQKDTALLRMLRGDRLDTTMNYRLRDAVLGLLAPGGFDPKGFGDSGRHLSASEFASRLASIREDYADAAYYSLMNLLDSHDTERLLWTLTPGPETRADKEQNAANVAAGKQRLRLASLIQFTVPGAPTVFYGDEVGLTGDDDPDDRRPYPWTDEGGSPDNGLLAHYRDLAALRKSVPALVDGDFRILLANDGDDTVAYGRKTGSQAAIVALNRSGAPRTLAIPVAGYVPDGTVLQVRHGTGAGATVAGGQLQVAVGPMSGVVLATGTVDLAPPSAPAGLQVTSEGNGQVALGWSGVAGAAGYNVYRSPVRGGGYVKANGAPITGTTFTDTGLQNARTYFFVVRALDAAGNESGDSNEVAALPHLTIGWANLQWPPSMIHTISAVDPTDSVYGQVWIDGVTNQSGPTESLRAQLGFGPDGSSPDGNAAWTWVEAAFNVDVGNNDEFVASLLPEATGTYDYAYRYTTTNGRDWVYADLDGIENGYSPVQAGSLTVQPSGDTTAPATPTGLHVVTASPAGIELAWNAVGGDPTLYGYEVLRGDASGGPYARVARVTSPGFTDTDVVEGRTYFYVVRAVDTSFNRSGNSAEVSATAELRTVQVVFDVTVPAPVEDAVGKSVYIAGSLNRLDGGLPEWNPGGVVLTKLDDTHWRVTLTGKEGTQVEYKYTLGSWDFVEKDASCGEIGNRQLTLAYGSTGTQVVADTVQRWRNVEPCGN
jgi:glycosidase/fibronectin type 3 domain-containing protein